MTKTTSALRSRFAVASSMACSVVPSPDAKTPMRNFCRETGIALLTSAVCRAERNAQARRIHSTPQPPGLWFGGALFWRGNEGIWGSRIGIEHQLAVARYIRSAQRCDVH